MAPPAGVLRSADVQRVRARMAAEEDAQLWWRHAKKKHVVTSPIQKALERELTLDEERDWMKKHKKTRKFEFTGAEKRILRQWFDVLDADHSGTVTTEELQDTLLTLGLASTADETQTIVNMIDTDGSGSVDFDEFVLALMPQSDKEGASDYARRERSFLGLKRSMEAQTKGLLDAKTHVSIERRKFLVNTITSRKCEDIDVAVSHALQETTKKRAPQRPSVNTLRLDGLNDVFRRSAAASQARLNAARQSVKPPEDMAATQAEVARRLEEQARLRGGCGSEQAVYMSSTRLPLIVSPVRAISEKRML
ncbi:hypothetical protein ACHHYP_07418 [Achlya hypogyna]|uniref:EF-hand domain-containing protein n=1 Tax=Achlya hypogyna TaxID=1202772 RepID=A0A1V9ZM68_ACHHY|nr:hypothetical protein ACHHYP_07418 [Achlya hypogyna]